MKNKLDELTDSLVGVMEYNDPTKEYPDFSSVKADDGVMAEWFYPVFNGSNEFSELSAILLYTNSESRFEDVSQLMLGISMTEMKHYGKLSDFILKLGGKIGQKFNNNSVIFAKDLEEAFSLAIKSEQDTIKAYQEIKKKLYKSDGTQTKTAKLAEQFIDKLIADENVHLKLLNEKNKK